MNVGAPLPLDHTDMGKVRNAPFATNFPRFLTSVDDFARGSFLPIFRQARRVFSQTQYFIPRWMLS